MKLNKGLLVIYLGFILLLSGCSSFFIGKENLSEPVDLPSDPQIIKFSRQWKRNIGHGTDEKELHLSPKVVDSRVFVVSIDGVLEALDLVTGKSIWQKKVGQTIASGVAADKNLVVVSSENGLLMAFSAVDGREGWTYQASTEILTPVNIVHGLVIARAIDGQVVALDARSGNLVWKQYIGVADLSIRGNSSGIYLDGSLLFTNDRGSLILISVVDGRKIFSTPLIMGVGINAVEQIADLLATPVLRNKNLFVSAYRQKTLALSLVDGSLLWESKYSTAKDLFADNRFIYLIDKNSLINILDLRTGKLLWTKKTLEGRRISPLTGNGNWIATVDNKGILNLLDAKGEYLGRTKVGDSVSYIAPQITQEGILTYTIDGDLTLTKLISP